MVYGNDKSNHVKCLIATLKRLKDSHLTMNQDKCAFVNQGVVLGSLHGYWDLLISEKVAKMLSMQELIDVAELSAF